MSDATTTPIAAFNPKNHFVTFEGLKDYDANLIRNLHSLGYNNKVGGANIFAWGNNNRIDGQNLFVFGNEFNLTSIAKRPSMFIGNGSLVSEGGWNDTENTIFGVWYEYSSAPIFRVGAEETASDQDWLSAAFSIRSNGSFSAAQNKFIVNANGSFSAANKNFIVNADGSFSAADKKFNVSSDGSFSAANGKFNVTPQGNITTSVQLPDGAWKITLTEYNDSEIILGNNDDDEPYVSVTKSSNQMTIKIPKKKITIFSWKSTKDGIVTHSFSLYASSEIGLIYLIAGTDIPKSGIDVTVEILCATTLPFVTID